MPRRTIKEFAAIIEMHPDCKYVVVEGDTDYKFIKWLYQESQKKDVSIVKIENIEVSAEKVFEVFSCTENNNRRRIIAFSHFMAEKGITGDSILCLIDKDFEKYICTIPSSTNDRLLLFTDYNSLDCCFIDNNLISKHIILTVGDFFIDAATVISCIDETLRKVFSIRLSNEKMMLKNEWLEMKSFIDFKNEITVFDDSDFISKYLAKNHKAYLIDDFTKEFKSILTNLDDDLKNSVRGHDFTYVLWLFISKHSNKYKINFNDFESYLLNCLEFDRINNFPSIQSLLAI